MPKKHDPNEGARYVVLAYRAPVLGLAPVRGERPSLPEAKRLAISLMDLDLDGDCYVEVEVVCERGEASARCYHHHRGESELKLRRALIALRRDQSDQGSVHP